MLNKKEDEKLKELVSSLHKTLLWYGRRGGLLPYDWNSYFQPKWVKLLEKLKIDITDGHIKKPDTRGYWR